MKLLISDIDGTLADKNEILTMNSIKAIALAKKHDFRVILASGNPYPVTLTISWYLGAQDWVIAETGCVIGNDWNYYQIFSDRNLILQGEKLLLKTFPGKVQISPTNSFRLADTAIYSSIPVEILQKTLTSHNLPLELRDSGFAIHIIPQGINKGFGLQEIIKKLKGSPEVIAVIGDGDNDLDLFKHATIKGAVSNATTTIKEQSDFISTGKFGDGVLEFVQYLIKNY